ncbi:hypothetical protein [Umezawaea tangerina]|uniref:Uncharacterized protein n=1 Tax=Umezawaea tangerina TaxID=84725 RepID=A0A2T0SPM0_9PSEU|nr:hypothetical protein [Umezawaea tangerina]PRY35355.1 hypothetical protein CLV43_114273 [Umezawaea tangerina]
MADASEERTTRVRPIRVPDPLWTAYGNVVARRGSNRTEALMEAMRQDIRKNGTDEDKALLDEAERELAERRSRKGGRPRKTE